MKAKIADQHSSAGHVPLASKRPSIGETHPKADDSERLCYCKLFDRFIELGVIGNFKLRDDEFKNRQSAAAIFGKQPKTLERMVEDGRLAWIKVGGSVLIHIPTSATLLRAGELWKHCPRCPQN